MTAEHPILLVEDNPDDERLVLLWLQRSHLINPVRVARDGAEAAALLFDRPADAEEPVLVLLDLHLPKLDGYEILRRLKSDAKTRHLPVLVMAPPEQENEHLRRLGVEPDGFVEKPIEFGALEAAVRPLRLRWRLCPPEPVTPAA